MYGSPTVERVVRHHLCSGCGLCASLTGGRMEVVEPGYNRPVIDGPVRPAAETVIAGACPGAKVAPWNGGRHRHPYWGPYIDMVTGHAANDQLRHRASSGGALSAVLAHALDSGQVDWVLEVAADPERPVRNVIIESRSAQDVYEGAGSRYAPSSPLTAIETALSRPGRFAFVGKPCDVSALRMLGRFDPRVAEKIPVMLSFFCAGVPSLAGAERVLGAMGIDPDSVETFRYRGHGWPGHATAIGADGSEQRMSYEDSWGGHLSKQVQFRCKICPDAVGGVADIVCADAWFGGESGYPQFDELPGRSLVVSRTETGANMLQAAVASGHLVLSDERVSDADLELMQPSQARRKRLVRARTAGLRILLEPVPEMSGLDVAQAAARSSWKEALRDMLGTMRRVIQGRR